LVSGLLTVLRNPQIWLNGLIGFLLYLSLSAFAELWGISYLEQARGLSKTHAAYANSLIFLGWASGAPLWGWFSDYIRLRRFPILMGSVLAFIVVCFLIYMPNLSMAEIDVLSFLFGLMCSAQVIVFAVCREVTSIKIAGTAIALTNMFVMIGGNFFQPIIGKLLDFKWMGTLSDGIRTYSPAAYQYALSILPISLFLTTLIALFFVRETYGRMGKMEIE
jgi:sugar phosphate permease